MKRLKDYRLNYEEFAADQIATFPIYISDNLRLPRWSICDLNLRRFTISCKTCDGYNTFLWLMFWNLNKIFLCKNPEPCREFSKAKPWIIQYAIHEITKKSHNVHSMNLSCPELARHPSFHEFQNVGDPIINLGHTLGLVLKS